VRNREQIRLDLEVVSAFQYSVWRRKGSMASRGAGAWEGYLAWKNALVSSEVEKLFISVGPATGWGGKG